MPPLWQSFSGSATVLLCLFVAGCSQSRGFMNGAAEINDLTSNSAPASAVRPSRPASASDGPATAEAVSCSSPDGKGSADAMNELATTLPVAMASTIDAESSPPTLAYTPQAVWGILDVRGFPVGQQVASNGVEYNQLFSLGLDFNVMLWGQQHLYLFSETCFWAQKAAPGITNANQGSFDFSKREFDFNAGVAWNYAGPWEARCFGYSFNNLNRGNSEVRPSGFNDGVGLENRFYIGDTYADLGTAAFDQARATFLSIGYYPTKSMVDGNGNEFKPGLFARAYLTWDLWCEQVYFFGDVQLIAARSFMPTLLNFDAGLAARPFAPVPRLEFRVGTQDMLDLQGGDLEPSVYLGIRYVY
jgi:hypothetical protein